MRVVIWFVLLFTAAVVAATTLGTNDGLVTFYWRSWRLDLSLNLFLILLIGTCFVLVTVIQAISGLLGLPQRAHAWRVARRDRSAQAAFRDALAQYFGGRYTRAQRSAQRALAIQGDTPELAQDNEFTVLGHLLAAGSAHRLQDRTGRDQALRQAFDLSSRSPAARSAEEGARLLAAEWALDDRDAPRAAELLAALPVGVARRTHALRLKLQAAGLLRSLAFETLDGAHDVDQLRRVWLQFDPVDRRDPFVAARAATRAAELGVGDEARGWLRPFWDRIGELAADERAALALALVSAVPGLGPEWLPRLEAAAQTFPRDGAVALAVGSALSERQLWGKSRRLLEQAAADVELAVPARRKAWLALARLAQQEDDAGRAAQAFEAAARLH
jgi:HemY protein